MRLNLVTILTLLLLAVESYAQMRVAPAPLYRDPITDGAADPVVIWNNHENSWWMLYTQRRANAEGADVAFCWATKIGVASSKDNGKTWVYRGELQLEFELGTNTFWAPDIVFDNGVYHLFVAYIQGGRNHWGGEKEIIHYTSTNMWDWKKEAPIALSSKSVIDATLFKQPDGKWKMWFKDEMNKSHTWSAQSEDLHNWTLDGEAVGGRGHEGPKVFRNWGYYWMITDEWAGLGVHRSSDLKNWERTGVILDRPTSRPDDTPQGAHADVLVVGDKAYIFYFTHPGRKSHIESPLDQNGNMPYSMRRSSIQVGELVFRGGTVECLRENFDFFLPNM